LREFKPRAVLNSDYCFPQNCLPKMATYKGWEREVAVETSFQTLALLVPSATILGV
jgi:hypothetical protein